MPIVINLDVELAKKKMSVSDLAAAVGITVANISILKNGRAKAVRFSTLDAICRVLGCQPGDILSYAEGPADAADDEGAAGDDTAGGGTRR